MSIETIRQEFDKRANLLRRAVAFKAMTPEQARKQMHEDLEEIITDSLIQLKKMAGSQSLREMQDNSLKSEDEDQ